MDSNFVESGNMKMVNGMMENIGIQENMLGYKTHLPFYESEFNLTSLQYELVKKSVMLPGNEQGVNYCFGVYIPENNYVSLRTDNIRDMEHKNRNRETGSIFHEDNNSWHRDFEPFVFELNTPEIESLPISIMEYPIKNTLYLEEFHPSPCMDFTSLKYVLKKSAKSISFSLTDYTGKIIETQTKQNQSRGNYTINLNTKDLGAGIYFYHVQIDNTTRTRKIIVQR